MNELTPLAVNADRRAFWQSSSKVSAALDTIYQVAEEEVDATLASFDKLSRGGEDIGLTDWSIRVSRDGIEVSSYPLEAWMHGRDWDAPGYCRNFSPDDTLLWLRSIISEHRQSLVRLLVRYSMRGFGYDQQYQCDRFANAVARKPVAQDTLNLDFKVDDFPFCGGLGD